MQNASQGDNLHEMPNSVFWEKQQKYQFYWPSAQLAPKIAIVKANTACCNITVFYPKYSDTSTPYHICSKIWTSTIYYPMLCLKIAGWVANSVDPDVTPRSAVSHLGLYFMLRPVCPNTYGKYGNPSFVYQKCSRQHVDFFFSFFF